METKKIGDFGESAACRFLEEKGYTILGRNYRSRYGEIDIIAMDGAYIVFIEVKTRKGTRYGNPSEYVDARKQERLVKTALQYIGEQDVPVRFDVLEVFYRERDGALEPTRVNHIENAFGGAV